MPDREAVLRQALEAGIDVMKDNFGDDYDRALVLRNIPLLLEVMWPFIDGYHERQTIASFEEQFHKRFPNHVLTNYGGTILDYIVGNVQTAVADEIVLMMETWVQTLEDAQRIPKFAHSTEKRDWEVAQAHTKELISEVKQYKSRGSHGHHSTHTGSIPHVGS